MITILTNLGLSRMWAWTVAIGAPILLLVGTGLAIDAWGDSRFRAGEKLERGKWEAASNKLLAESANASTQAEKNAAAAALDFAARQQIERDRINDALENGSSPVDALFPVGNGM